MLPVIGKVIKHKGRDPNEGRVCRKLAQLETGDDKLVNERRKTHNHKTAEGAKGAHRQAIDGVVEAVGVASAQQAVNELKKDEADKKRDCDSDKVHGFPPVCNC